MLMSFAELAKLKSRDSVKLECYKCKKIFTKPKNRVLVALNNDIGIKLKYCSCACNSKDKMTAKIVNCKNCNRRIRKTLSEIKRNDNQFCCKSCAAIYNNSHKTKGNRRSKLECWLEQKLAALYPKLEMHYNRKDAINSELDIYIPSLKLAFELNGIFHYEPIFGGEKLNKIKNNDDRKFQACLEKQIELCIIDVSKIKYFKESSAIKYLNIICSLIESKT